MNKEKTKIMDEIFASRMAEYNSDNDIESVHVKADDLLCDILKELGFEKTVAEFYNLEKWYA